MRSVIFALFLRELKTRLDGRWGGAIWVIGEPMLNIGAMLIVYGALRAHSIGGVDTIMFLISGQLPYLIFKSMLLRLMEGIDANQGLFAYRQVKPIDAVIARALVEVMLAAAVILLFAAALAWGGHHVVPAQPLQYLASLVLLTVLGGAFGLMAAVATAGPLAKARGLVRMALMPIYLASGAVMPLASLPQVAQDFLLLNPLAHSIETSRAALFGPGYQAVERMSWAVPASWALAASLLSLSLYRVRRERLLTG